MASINYSDLFSQPKKLDFGEFASLVKGASITNLTATDKFVDFWLSDGFLLRIDAQNDIMLSQNLKFRLPIRLNLIDNNETPTAQLVESRLHALRQIYAIDFLVDAGREIEMAQYVIADSSFDLETLIDHENKLFIVSASEGSFWLTVVAKTEEAFKSLRNIVPLFYDEGRQAVLRRVSANTELIELDVESKHVDVEMKKANGLIDLYNKIEKIKDPLVREQLKAKLTENIIASGNTLPTLPSSKLRKRKSTEE
jgi:hypothetical protein